METLPRLKTITKGVGATKHFALCVDNSEYPVALELHKVYAVLPDARAAEDDFLRVVDESGEDYLYAARRFVLVDLPQHVKRSWVRRIRESATLASHTSQPTRRAQPKSRTSRNSLRRPNHEHSSGCCSTVR